MASLESLSDAQRAVLQLLLKQGRSYDELAGPKGDPAVVRRRAHDALDALAPSGGEVGVERRREIADYLLGQQSASRRAETREYLERSTASRAWARAAAAALKPVGGSLPDVPAEPEELEQAFDALERRSVRQEEVQRSSQMGGRLLFGFLGLVLAIGLLWAFGTFDSKKKAAAVPTTTGTTTTAAAARYEPLETATLKSTDRSSKATGVAVIARRAGTQDLSVAIRAIKLPASSRQGSAYGVWLYTSPKTGQFVGFPTRLVGKDGALEAAFQLASNTGSYREVLLTRETQEKPTAPGAILLRGPLQLVPASARQPSQTQP